MADSKETEVAAAGGGAKPMDCQLRDFWEEHGDRRGVPQGVRDLLNAAFTKVPVSSFPDLPSGKGITPRHASNFVRSSVSCCIVDDYCVLHPPNLPASLLRSPYTRSRLGIYL